MIAFSLSYRKRLHIGAHDPLDPADPSMESGARGAPLLKTLLERFQGHIQSDLVSVLETVSNDHGDVGHLYRDPFDLMFLYAGGERFAAGTHVV